MINVKLNGITLQFDDATALIDLMTPEDRAEVIESISCYDDVIKHVADQISQPHGYTENGFSGSSRCGVERITGNGTVLDNARYQVAASASESSQKVIEEQAKIITNQSEEIERLRTEVYKLKNPRSTY
ncbi:hypothetical protein [Ewingella americana]|uniref:hypothetical protein n=1 Tax=Ewingella americana TaxID=41202 RepID=UPI0012AD8D70|nr:hypothetical protein [Ewingella americana]MRT01915.1 hypothetical protein [Ewingella americana]